MAGYKSVTCTLAGPIRNCTSDDTIMAIGHAFNKEPIFPVLYVRGSSWLLYHQIKG